ncbi:carboxypeptidase A1 [Capsaspora owczarzaki ATCC 30864]|uniref:Carboxypeptidase A1 n=1 Tax=Capsaspora owczarzaki (strain ATCC 30864) TaxID=595528 RepID=A0A0D2U6R7_CAPO3|nr:carboxypeptidase A1 [Capsaspora owczarzaki ATCC 30864]KJE90866.1 carboxypeptidase A1 [Capsaspora owczarzaki ATCC 30864]|eukprot:XP_004348856.1 carboxypeptidase A1 [Capsaspora owczarzaki ATCC 30864]
MRSSASSALVVLALVALAAASAFAAPAHPHTPLAGQALDGHKVYRITAQSDEQLRMLNSFVEMWDTYVDVWRDIRSVEHPVDIRVPESLQKQFVSFLDMIEVEHTVIVENVAELVQEQMDDIRARASSFVLSADNVHDDGWYSNYQTFENITAWLTTLQAKYPSLVTINIVGTTYEGRSLPAITISSNSTSGKPKPGIWIDAGIHAREWITTGTAVYMIGNLLEGYGVNANITAIVDAFDWTILPVFNADGYTYTWSNALDARMWRKTRSKNAGSLCVGTDPNRNWDFHWGEAGTSTNPCSDSYQGKSAFSEIEIKSVADYIKTKGTYVIYVDLHSYGQLWMSPWGYTDTKPADFNTQDAGSIAGVNAVVAAATTLPAAVFTHGTICSTIYPASGSSADWTYGVAGIVYSYGIELRDTGTYGFVLPASYIVPSGNEMLAGFIALAKYVATQLK